MKILISNASDSPLYEQIKEQIKDAILKEETPERETIPTNHSGRTEDTTPQNPTLQMRKTD